MYYATMLSDFIFFGFSVNQLMVYQLYQVLVYFAPQGLVPKGHTSVSSSCKISLFWADTSYFFKFVCCAISILCYANKDLCGVNKMQFVQVSSILDTNLSCNLRFLKQLVGIIRHEPFRPLF
jgi:hypothetical protein